MARVVVMPQLGNTVESCLVTAWLVAVGDTVDEASLLCEIETDKSTMEVPSGVSGTVLALLAQEGDDVPVKEPIAVIGTQGESVADALAEAGFSGAEPLSEGAAPAPETPDTPSPAPATAVAAPVATSAATSAASPRAKHLAANAGLPLSAVAAGTGPHGRVIERDVRATLDAGPALTRGAAATADSFASAASGTGLGGRVTTSDLTTPVPAAVAAASSAAAAVDTAFPGGFADTPLKGVRKIIAERMMESLASSAQLTYTATAPAAGLMALRKRLKDSDPSLGMSSITVGDLVGYAAVRTLANHPLLNAHLANNVLRKFDSVHLGMAVDTPRGLLVPTLRFASGLTLREFSAQSKALAGEAIGGSISPDLLTGASFTVSNLGAFGIESFTPLLNVPQVAILGVDAIFPRATIKPDGTVGAEQRIGLSLTADHRVIDGADAARYLKDLAVAIANIDLTVMG